jgi:hypothetical protein
MATDHIVSLLIAERDKLNRAIEALQGSHSAPIESPKTAPAEPMKKRHISAASRRKMAVGQKKRWAALKAAK